MTKLIHISFDSVSSGGQGMAFYWRGNQLFARQGPIDEEDQVWTTFLMDMREPIEVNIYSRIKNYTSSPTRLRTYLFLILVSGYRRIRAVLSQCIGKLIYNISKSY